MGNKGQDESHDWLADAAESLVRYYLSGKEYFVYGSSKWGGDSIVQHKSSRRALVVEVKSREYKEIAPDISNMKKKKLPTPKRRNPRPDIYAEVLMRKDASLEMKIYLWAVMKSGKLSSPKNAITSDAGKEKIKEWLRERFNKKKPRV